MVFTRDPCACCCVLAHRPMHWVRVTCGSCTEHVNALMYVIKYVHMHILYGFLA